MLFTPELTNLQQWIDLFLKHKVDVNAKDGDGAHILQKLLGGTNESHFNYLEPDRQMRLFWAWTFEKKFYKNWRAAFRRND